MAPINGNLSMGNTKLEVVTMVPSVSITVSTFSEKNVGLDYCYVYSVTLTFHNFSSSQSE